MNQVDYAKIDPWIKKNPEGRYKQFKAKYPKVAVSIWTFEKRRRHVLNLPLSPSMQPGYRSPYKGTPRTKNSCIYSTLLSMSTSDLEGKKDIEVIQLLIEQLNASLKLGLEAVQITLMGEGNTPMIEIRRYSK
jgi:hypothetical protein